MKTYKRGRLLSVTSDSEMERRWRLTREFMAKNDVDCIIMYGNDAKQGGAVRYYTDWAGDTSYGFFVLFPKDEGMALFGHGTFGETAMPAVAARGIDCNYGVPFTPEFVTMDDYIPIEAVRYLQKRGYKKFGIYRKSQVPVYFVDYILQNINGATLMDVSDGIDLIRAVKSEEEIEILKSVVSLHDDFYASLPLYIRPGRLERDVAADIKKVVLDIGSESFNISLSTGKGKVRHKIYELQNEVIREGDTLDVYVEVCFAGQYWGGLSRMWCLGEPSQELKKAVSDSVAVQTQLAAMAKPGVKAVDLRTELHRFEEENGYKKDSRLFGHGQGIDMLERPAFVEGENMALAENMFLCINPGLETESIWGFNADNFLVTKDGAVRLSKTPQGIFTI